VIRTDVAAAPNSATSALQLESRSDFLSLCLLSVFASRELRFLHMIKLAVQEKL